MGFATFELDGKAVRGLESDKGLHAVDAEVMQHTKLDDLIFSIPRPINYISTFSDLVPGGVGARRDPRVWMKPGDEIEIDKIGLLSNTIVAET